MGEYKGANREHGRADGEHGGAEEEHIVWEEKRARKGGGLGGREQSGDTLVS